jgi:hypothetical protein
MIKSILSSNSFLRVITHHLKEQILTQPFKILLIKLILQILNTILKVRHRILHTNLIILQSRHPRPCLFIRCLKCPTHPKYHIYFWISHKQHMSSHKLCKYTTQTPNIYSCPISLSTKYQFRCSIVNSHYFQSIRSHWKWKGPSHP